MLDARFLAARYQAAHNEMRNIDGLQPQEAFDELLKYVFFKERDETTSDPISFLDGFASIKETKSVAKAIRSRFRRYVVESKSIPNGWGARGFHLSDLALVKVHAIFQGLKLTASGLDIRSAALREFLTGPIRKGLGIFLTPESVVQAIVEALRPTHRDRILDPACGSGTFLFDAVQGIQRSGAKSQVKIYGVDKNPRMIQLAEFNCGHLQGSSFQRSAFDALLPFGSPGQPEWFKEGAFDVVLTNPPFGVVLDERAYSFQEYATCQASSDEKIRRQGSEIVFLERALQLLRPGGRLGIVLPRSVITNRTLHAARLALGQLGCVRALVTLPPETFAATGTQTTTVVLVVEKYGKHLTADSRISTVVCRIQNVGFDMTGRQREGSELPALGKALGDALSTGNSSGRAISSEPTRAAETFVNLDKLIGEARPSKMNSSSARLGDLVDLATTGSTPPRAAYADSGLFLIKVGNLSGAGVNWVARDRNYVKDKLAERYLRAERLVRDGDLLLTSSAHSPKYIGKKVDIIAGIPAEVGGRASYVGEVMLLRPSERISPYLLLAYMRSTQVMQALQDRVRGQTAHLHPADVLDLAVDEALLRSSALQSISDLLKKEASLSNALNDLAFEQIRLRQSLDKLGGSQIAAE